MVAADVARLEYTSCANDAAVVLYTIGRRPCLAGEQADAGLVAGAHEPQHRRDESDVGVLS